MAIGGVVINFAAKSADAIRDVDKLARSLTGVGKESDDTNSKMGKLSGVMKAGVAAGAVAAGTAVLALGDFLIEAGQAALEDYRSSQKLADVLSNIPGITQKAIDANEEWITSMQLATLVSDTDLRDAVGKLALATGDLEEAQKLAALATDVAAGSGKDYKTVADAMAKAAAGNTSQLERQFPWLDKNKDGTVDLKEATDGLGDAYAGAAKKAADRDPWNRLKTIWDELKESLGSYLIPVIEEFGDWFKSKKNQAAIQDVITQVGDLSKSVGEDLVPAIRDFLKYISSDKFRRDLSNFADDVTEIYNALRPLVSALIDATIWTGKLWNEVSKFGLGGLIGFLTKIKSATTLTTSSANPTTATSSTTSTRASGTSIGSVTINLQSSGYTYEDARRLKRALEGYDVGQGRQRGTPLAVAW